MRRSESITIRSVQLVSGFNGSLGAFERVCHRQVDEREHDI